jgi:hypothetical protein
MLVCAGSQWVWHLGDAAQNRLNPGDSGSLATNKRQRHPGSEPDGVSFHAPLPPFPVVWAPTRIRQIVDYRRLGEGDSVCDGWGRGRQAAHRLLPAYCPDAMSDDSRVSRVSRFISGALSDTRSSDLQLARFPYYSTGMPTIVGVLEVRRGNEPTTRDSHANS